MSKVKIIDFGLCVNKQKSEKRQKTLDALKDIYTNYKVLGKHDKSGETYFIVEER